MGEYLISNLGGSVATYTASGTSVALDVNLTAPITIGSVSATVDSVYIQSGNNLHLGSAWSGIGSIRVAEWGITTPITTTGSFINYGIGSIRVSEWGVIGSIIGSVAITTNPIPISGQIYLLNRTSVLSDVYTSSSGVTTNFSGNAIPNGFNLVIKSFSTNTEYIGIGSRTILFAQSGLRLYPNDSIRIGVDNSNRLSFVTRVNNEGVEIFTET